MSESVKFVGKGVAAAIAVGQIRVLKRQNAPVVRRRIDNIEAELCRWERAKETAKDELLAVREKALREVGESGAQIFEIHRMMLDDEDFGKSVESMIRDQSVNAEWATAMTADNFAAIFSDMEDGYMQARAADVHDIAGRLIRCLSDGEEAEMSSGSYILAADDLAPGETVALDKTQVLAFVTAHGSVNSHTAILARSMNIPAVVGVGSAFLNAVKDGMQAIVNGGTGEIELSPDEDAIACAKQEICEQQAHARLLEKLRGKENVTRDGHKIEILANIGSEVEIGEVLRNDAGGIGLFRSEFLYLDGRDFPSEEEQFAVYRRVLSKMAGKRVIIRTLDIGADKQSAYFKLEREENPALGLRGIRLCLSRPEIFRTQLRALYRASAYGKLGIMFPMITSEGEVAEILSLCEQIKAELAAADIPMGEQVERGIMIETPAAAIISDRLAPMVDFFSVGTNDLTQYTLACDRQNQAVESYADSHHAAVLRLIALAAENAHRSGKWIGICGELAADTSLTADFLRMGIDELSVSPSFVLKVREKVRNSVVQMPLSKEE